MSKLLLVKHSEPLVNLEMQPSKWELSDRGKLRAGLLADYLAGREIDALYSSSEVKAIQTAEIVNELNFE